MITLDKVAEELGRRLANNFLPDKDGKRAVFALAGYSPMILNGEISCLFISISTVTQAAAVVASPQTGLSDLIASIAILMAAREPPYVQVVDDRPRWLGDAAKR